MRLKVTFSKVSSVMTGARAPPALLAACTGITSCNMSRVRVIMGYMTLFPMTACKKAYG